MKTCKRQNKQGWVNQDALQKTGVHTAVEPNAQPRPSPSSLSLGAPAITIAGPKNNSAVANNVVTLRGNVTDNISAANQLTFFINNQQVPLDTKGNFNIKLKLNTGANTFSLLAQGPAGNPRQQTNNITSYIDASVVYGSDQTRVNALRTFQGGKLKTSTGNLPSFNTANLPNANDSHIVPNTQLFLAGDVRGNENIGLTSIQTLFIREHNTIADIIAKKHPNLTDEQIYQWSRRIVIAEIQEITFNEFLPSLLGSNAPGKYKGYDATVNPGVSNEFANGAYRIGHSMVDTDIHFFDNNDQDSHPAVPLQQAFFNPIPIEQFGVDGILKYFAGDNQQEIDPYVIDPLRNFLFGPPGAGGFDLASLNIQRGRDHGLADYNSIRQVYGLPRIKTFNEITSVASVAAALQTTYGDVNNIDLWVGGLAENHLPGSDVGPTFTKVIVDQFERTRDGDRFWYQRLYSGKALADIQSVTLADIIRRNSTITNLQDNVFLFTKNKTVTHTISQTVALNKLTKMLNDIPQPNSNNIESIDGGGNNKTHPTWGEAGTDFLRMAPVGYSDDIASLAGTTRPSARVVSNNINAMQGDPDNFSNETLANMVWGWGQFMDHDLDLTNAGTTPANIPVPKRDPNFDPKSTGTQIIPFNRSSADPATGDGETKTTKLTYQLIYIQFSNLGGTTPNKQEQNFLTKLLQQIFCIFNPSFCQQ